MFDSYDDRDFCYEMIYPDGKKVTKTKQGLSEFFVFTEHNLGYDFDEFINKLDKGYVVSAEDNSYDYGAQSYKYNGNILINKIKEKKIASSNTPPPMPNECDHKDNYVNIANGIKFRVCRKCLKDMGNV